MTSSEDEIKKEHIEAAHAYNKAAILLHGEFARLNPVGVDHVR